MLFNLLLYFLSLFFISLQCKGDYLNDSDIAELKKKRDELNTSKIKKNNRITLLKSVGYTGAHLSSDQQELCDTQNLVKDMQNKLNLVNADVSVLQNKLDNAIKSSSYYPNIVANEQKIQNLKSKIIDLEREFVNQEKNIKTHNNEIQDQTNMFQKQLENIRSKFLSFASQNSYEWGNLGIENDFVTIAQQYSGEISKLEEEIKEIKNRTTTYSDYMNGKIPTSSLQTDDIKSAIDQKSKLVLLEYTNALREYAKAEERVKNGTKYKKENDIDVLCKEYKENLECICNEVFNHYNILSAREILYEVNMIHDILDEKIGVTSDCEKLEQILYEKTAEHDTLKLSRPNQLAILAHNIVKIIGKPGEVVGSSGEFIKNHESFNSGLFEIFRISAIGYYENIVASPTNFEESKNGIIELLKSSTSKKLPSIFCFGDKCYIVEDTSIDIFINSENKLLFKEDKKFQKYRGSEVSDIIFTCDSGSKIVRITISK